MTATWRTLTFGDLRVGDIVKLDEEGPEETVRVTDCAAGLMWYRSDLSCGYQIGNDPVLVRFPRPSEGEGE